MDKIELIHKIDLKLREILLQLTSLSIIYSKNTSPERGYLRAKKFIEEFNEYIPNLNLSTNEIDEIMNMDYINDFNNKSIQKHKNLRGK